MLGYSCSLWCRQFWLILLKNFILQIRRPIGTIFELLLPCLAVVVIIALRYTLFQPKERCFATFSTYDLSYPEMYVFYTPNTIQSLEVVSRANVLLPNAVFVGVDSEDGILQEIAQLDKGDHPRYAGVILPNNLEQSFHNILITIRETHEVGGSHSWFTVRQTAIFRGFSPRRGNTYYRHGFLHLQNAISFGLTQWKLNSSGVSIDPPVVKIRQMAFPTYTSDIFLEGIVLALPVLLVLGYLYSAGVFTQELVLEKESRLRESMKMMGLKPSALFSAWFVKQFLFLMITGIVVSLLIKFGGILPKSDFFLLLLFVLLFLFSLISYGFFMSSFFSSSRVSLFSAFLVWFLILFPYLVLALSYSELSLGVKMATCLFSNTCAGFAVNFISSLEIHGEGMNWSNAFQPSTIEDPFHLGVVFGMLLLDSVLYLVFAWYKQAVFPGKYGVPKPFYFPFLPSYWLGRPLRKKSVFPSATNELADLRMEANNFEQEPVGLNCGIKIRNMTKIYQRCCRKQKVAVNDLSLNMYEGQITALLGHNGAGKTTTMSVLTGLYTPTSGDAIINRYSILTDMDEIRKNLGLCPQHNVLFERLTVKEHLMLFGMLKGAMGKSLYDDVKLMISDLQLDDKRNVAVKKLSGGMKRKLSVGIALIGGSKFVILDEPTSGMDPYARRSTWDLLGKYKKNRTILLTTHHMDEADILGDRIAIMAEGKLLTSGSSLFLKSRFGVGYHLTMVKGRDTSSDRICEVVTSTIDGAEMVGDVAGELSFVLPSHLTDHYPELFDKLETNKETLGIISYGVSAPTIQDVFLRITRAVEDSHFNRSFVVAKQPDAVIPNSLGQSVEDVVMAWKDDGPGHLKTISTPTVSMPTVSTSTISGNTLHLYDGQDKHGGASVDVCNITEKDANTGVKLWIQQFRAMIVKRALNTFRNPGVLVSQLVLPLVFVTLGLTFLKTLPSWLANDPPRQLTLKESSPYTGIKMFYADFEDTSPGPNDILKTLDASLLQVSSFLNITEGVNNIRQEVLTHNNSALCCDYSQQLLDNYCLSINSSVYFSQLDRCRGNSQFGYRSCVECLDRSFSNREVPCYFRRPRPVQPPLQEPVDDVHSYVDEYWLRFAAENIQEYTRHYQLGFTAERDPSSGSSVFTVWYNNQFYHTCPSALSAFHNTYMNYLLTRYNVSRSTSSVTFVNHPLPRTQEGLLEQRDSEYAGFIISTTVVFGFSFLLAGFTLFLVNERAIKAKHLQFVSGVSTFSFWMANLVWDMLTSLVIVGLSVALFAAFQIQQFLGENICAVFLLMVALCWTGVPLSYCISFFFSSQLLSFAVTVMTMYFGSMIMTVVVWQVGIDNPDLADTLQYIFTPFPSFCFSLGVDNIFFNQLTKDICTVSNVTRQACEEQNLKYVESVFSMDVLGIGINLCVLLGEGVLLTILLCLLETSCCIQKCGFCSQRFGYCSKEPVSALDDEDGDVAIERLRVAKLNKSHSKDVLIIDSLVKSYSKLCGIRSFRNQATTAVRNISVGIEHGECFGLLGVNGAGKTTTFKILTGDLEPTSGTAFIAGDDIKKNIKGAQQHLGYCPQFDALLERMTGEELLTMFCRLRGIPEKKIPHIVKTEIKRLDLEKYAKKRCGTYSGGNKRKLSAALSLVGDPPVVLLDEPTSGMDPKSRRKVWEVLSSAVSQGRSVVLCSHSMEECEALCTRLAIMVNGEFKCLGSVQHLKNKFGKGYILNLKLVDSNVLTTDSCDLSYLELSTSVSDVWSETSKERRLLPRAKLGGEPSNLSLTTPTVANRNISAVFPGAVYKEKHQDVQLIQSHFLDHRGSRPEQWCTYYIPSNGLSWSEIFRKLEEHKEYLGIEDYSVSQTTLEQVFLDFAAYHHAVSHEGQ